ncbi:hypothetical protein NKG94_50150 [Micromonospora sp. M12]
MTLLRRRGLRAGGSGPRGDGAPPRQLASAAGIDVGRLDAWCRVTAPIGATYVSNPVHSAELAAFGRGEY